MKKIEEIAGEHLGKAGDGTAVKPYQTPDHIDASLLVPVPRHLNRTQYNISDDDLPFVGWDVWNCYEVSFLTENGYPVSGVLKLSYVSDSDNIVESKSLKLYLNSFNMVKIKATVKQSISFVTSRVKADLVDILGLRQDELKVYFHYNEEIELPPPAIIGNFVRLETLVDEAELVFESYNEDPSILEYSPMIGYMPYQVTTNALRSNCRVTNQPDWGDVYIYIDGGDCVTPESLLQYIVSMRRENHFHEEICECIFKRLHDLLGDDTRLLVACLYTRRGGIDINPVRATDEQLLEEVAPYLISATSPHRKTARQ